MPCPLVRGQGTFARSGSGLPRSRLRRGCRLRYLVNDAETESATIQGCAVPITWEHRIRDYPTKRTGAITSGTIEGVLLDKNGTGDGEVVGCAEARRASVEGRAKQIGTPADSRTRNRVGTIGTAWD